MPWLALADDPVDAGASQIMLVKSHFLGANDELTQQLDIRQSERFSLLVDIYTDTWFAEAPRVNSFTIDGAIVVRTERFATNFSEHIQGDVYTVQRWKFDVFPQRSGQMIVPGIEVKALVAGYEDKPGRHMSARSSPLLLTVQPLPDNAFAQVDVDRPLSSTEVVMEEYYRGDTTNLKIGDVLERQVDVAARDSLSMLIPPLDWPELSGVRQQTARTQVKDSGNRGIVWAERTEVRSYIFERHGEFTLPQVRFNWWDPEQQDWQQSVLPEKTVRIAPAARGEQPEGALSRDLQWVVEDIWYVATAAPDWIKGLALGCLLLVLLLLAFGSRLRDRLLSYWQSERGWRWRLWLASLVWPPGAILRCYYRWHSVLEAERVEACSDGNGDEVNTLLARLYDHYRRRQSLSLRLRWQWLQLLSVQRKRTASSQIKRSGRRPLPPLNPPGHLR
ncbi:MAG: hypothetical protein AseanaTS_02210 [Candidatus Pelagadaptatus aseana]